MNKVIITKYRRDMAEKKLRFPRARHSFSKNASGLIRMKISALILAVAQLKNGLLANAADVTPQNKYLPFGPSDVYNTTFHISTDFDRSDNAAAASYSQYLPVFST